ncbi:MAG TPA: exopolyphosphatase, partial [Thiothrix sp.]|nr:exopolyphosphatase [Thiothrix sp.]
EALLGHQISVVAGREEARLIYLGVSHTLAKQDDMQRLVIDIGGGSTELIIGKDFEPLHLESLNMGCVSMSRFFHVDGDPTQQDFSISRWQRANLAAHLELRPIKQDYRTLGWDHATGASGTIKAVAKVIRALQLAPSGIRLDDLYTVREKVIAAKTLDKLDLPDLNDDRRSVFAGGLSVLIAVFEALNIQQIQASDGALREGLIHELYGRSQQKDIRGQTVKGLQQRFQINANHAKRISERALILFDHVADAWQLDKNHRQLLAWSAQLHEIGLSIAHSGYHKHGAYILQEADLAGFSRQEQNWMSVLVRNHRRKVSSKTVQEQLCEAQQNTAIYLLILLRLAVLLHRSRKDEVAEIAAINAHDDTLCLYFAADELMNRPLLQADLAQEQHYLQKLAIRLHVTSIATRDI